MSSVPKRNVRLFLTAGVMVAAYVDVPKMVFLNLPDLQAFGISSLRSP